MRSPITGVAASILVAALASAAPLEQPQPTRPAQAGPQPLDPLTAQERRAAERVASADARVRELLGPGGRVNYLEFISIKPERESDPPGRRHAEVVFLRDDAQYGVRAVIGLGPQAAVIAVDKIPERDVPMTSVDVEAARKIAFQNPEVANFQDPRLAKARAEGLRIIGTEDSDPCTQHRCVRLLFKVGADYLSEPIVIVDLTAGRALVQRRQR